MDYNKAQKALKSIMETLSIKGRKQCAEDISYLQGFLSEGKKAQKANGLDEEIRPIDEVVAEVSMEYDASKMELNIDEYRGL